MHETTLKFHTVKIIYKEKNLEVKREIFISHSIYI